MKPNKVRLINFVKKNGGIVRFSSLLKEGFHPDDLHFLENESKIERVARGLYKLTNNTLGAHPDLILATMQASKGVVCLISALSFHEVTTEIPTAVDLAIPLGTWTNKIKYPPVKFYHFSVKTWEAGIETHQVQGHSIKIFSLPKTIADCFKFRNQIGINIARDALKSAINEKKTKPQEIMKYAEICRVDKIIKPILETLI